MMAGERWRAVEIGFGDLLTLLKLASLELPSQCRIIKVADLGNYAGVCLESPEYAPLDEATEVPAITLRVLP